MLKETDARRCDLFPFSVFHRGTNILQKVCNLYSTTDKMTSGKYRRTNIFYKKAKIKWKIKDINKFNHKV